MCLYCNLGDHVFKHKPPYNPPYPPQVPIPVVPLPIVPWPLKELKEFSDILRKIKELEDKAGCPCEPNKANYLDIFEKRIKKLEENEVAKKKFTIRSLPEERSSMLEALIKRLENCKANETYSLDGVERALLIEAYYLLNKE